MKAFVGLLVVVVLLIVGVVGGALYGVSVSNQEVRLRNKAVAQQKANEAVFDNMWKTIAQTCEVKDDYKDTFRDSWTKIIASQNTGEAASAIKVTINRINPKLSSSIFKQTMTVIEGSRKEFLNNQKQLVDIKREHDDIRQTWPGSMICGDRPELEITVITSTRTNTVFKDGKDDNIDLRPKQK
jgi:uncharacterized protein YneF (UPF0154 family)